MLSCIACIIAHDDASHFTFPPLHTQALHCDQNRPGILETAALCGHLELCKLLLGQREHPAIPGHTAALFEAAKSGCVEVCELLRTAPNRPSKVTENGMLVATMDLDVCTLLVEHGARLDWLDEHSGDIHAPVTRKLRVSRH